MKISFVEPHLRLYGGIRRIIELANRLVARGHEVTIFHPDGRPCSWMRCDAAIKKSDDLLLQNHKVIIYNSHHPPVYYLVKKARSDLKVFYALGLYSREFLKSGIPLWYFLCNPRDAARMFFIERSLRSGYLVLSNSTWMHLWLLENMGIDSKLLIGGVNTGIFYPASSPKRPDRITVLCSGDPRKGKGTRAVLRAIEAIKKEEPRISLDTYYNKGIPQEKMAEVYSSADIFVDNQQHGGWNNPVAEAMACRVPVVCSDIGAVGDFAFHEKTALLVPVDDSEAIGSSVLRLIRDSDLSERLRENAYQHIRRFTWDASAARLEEIVATAIDEG